jgi:hypothetical protein
MTVRSSVLQTIVLDLPVRSTSGGTTSDALLYLRIRDLIKTGATA